MKAISGGTVLRGLAAALLLLASGWAQAQTVPSKVNFEGRLTDSAGNLINGTQNLTLRIFNVLTNGSPIWSETQNGVSLSSGVFAIQLGAQTPLTAAVFASSATFLEFQVGGEILTPRKTLVATPYAANAGTLQGIIDTNLIWRDTGTGNVGINASAAGAGSQRLYVHGTAAAPTMLIQNSGTNDEILRLVTSGSGVSMSLQANQIYSSGVLNIGAGQNTYFRTDLGGSVGIGSTAPTQKLDVAGNIRASAFCVPGADTAQGDCATAFANCTVLNYTSTPKAKATPVDDKEVSCGTVGKWVINMQLYAAGALTMPLSSAISLCFPSTASGIGPTAATGGCNSTARITLASPETFTIDNYVGTILCCQ